MLAFFTAAITCPRLAYPTNGQVDQPTGSPEYGSQATFTCNSGYRYSQYFYNKGPKFVLIQIYIFNASISFVRLMQNKLEKQLLDENLLNTTSLLKQIGW